MNKADEVVVPRDEVRACLAELLRLYKWRFELAAMEKDPIFGGQVKGLLNKYGREKKAAWQLAEQLLAATPIPVPASGITVEQIDEYAAKLAVFLDNSPFGSIMLNLIVALARRAVSAQEPVYVIFDGPPSHESGRFVEVETENGKSVSVGKWENYSGKYWRLGPLYAKPTDSG